MSQVSIYERDWGVLVRLKEKGRRVKVARKKKKLSLKVLLTFKVYSCKPCLYGNDVGGAPRVRDCSGSSRTAKHYKKSKRQSDFMKLLYLLFFCVFLQAGLQAESPTP